MTANPAININRIKTRGANGGHFVPDEKVISRYYKALDLIPRLVEVCDVCHIYDNTDLPVVFFHAPATTTIVSPSPKSIVDRKSTRLNSSHWS